MLYFHFCEFLWLRGGSNERGDFIRRLRSSNNNNNNGNSFTLVRAGRNRVADKAATAAAAAAGGISTCLLTDTAHDL